MKFTKFIYVVVILAAGYPFAVRADFSSGDAEYSANENIGAGDVNISSQEIAAEGIQGNQENLGSEKKVAEVVICPPPKVPYYSRAWDGYGYYGRTIVTCR